MNLPIPDQEIVTSNHGWGLEFRAPLPVEGWNAQLSLLTTTKDVAEGIGAFFEKREPRWSGR